MPSCAPVGEWVSPITSDLITSQVVKLAAPTVDEHGRVFWLEGRPSEGGRQVLVMRDQEGIKDVTPAPDTGFNVRTTVHEYGGGDYMVANCTAFFSNFSDQRVYSQEVPLVGPVGAPTPLTPSDEGLRFADFSWDAARQRLVAVAERHDPAHPDSHHVDNFLVSINVKSGAVTTLTNGHDFYSNPRISPSGSRMSWVAWDMPNMPWDGTLLMVADVGEDGLLSNISTIAGGPEESVQQPVWSPDGRSLFFVSDRSGWWNLYCHTDHQTTLVHKMTAEFGFPQWLFGLQSYQVHEDGRLLALYQDPKEAGICLGVVTPGHGMVKLDVPYAFWGGPARISACKNSRTGKLTLAAVVGGPNLITMVVVTEAEGIEHLPKSWEAVRSSAAMQLDPGYLSAPQPMAFPTDHGKEAHMLFYPPTNKDFTLPEGQRAPLLVRSHGGPTSAANVALDLNIQFLTSRGFAVADVDYGGSTGYGREYRNRLRGAWGVVDVSDCSNAAVHLAAMGHVDSKRMCIFGQSAGGFSTLACLAFRDTFAAGASHFGVADLEMLAKETHKFESRYMDTMVGPYPECKDVYEARSPIRHVDCFKAPIIFFQGDQDKVVPPSQAVQMHAAVKQRGLPTALLLFKGEQHGFRKPESIRMSLDGMVWFLGRVLGFQYQMPDDLPNFCIDNLDA